MPINTPNSTTAFIKAIFIFAFCLFLQTFALAQSVNLQQDENGYLILNEKMKHVDISDYSEHHVDQDDNYELYNLIHNIDHQNQKVKNESPSSWLKIKVHNNSNQRRLWLIDTGLPSLLKLDAFSVTDKWQIKHIVSLNRHSKFADRVVYSPHVAIPIELSPFAYEEIYINYQVMGDIPVMFDLYSEKQFDLFVEGDFLITGIILGILVCFLGMIVIQYMMRKDTVLLIYAGLIIIVILLISDITGVAFQYFWPNVHDFDDLAPKLLVILEITFYLLFIKTILRTSKNTPWLNRIYHVYFALAATMFICSFYFDIILLMIITNLFVLILAALTIYVALSKKLPFSKFIAASFFNHILFINVLFVLSILEVNLFGHIHYVVYLKLGYLFEVMLFAMLLAYQNKQVQQAYNDNLRQKISHTEQMVILESDKNKLLEENQKKLLKFASITHDIRQPLASIKMALQILRKGENENALNHIENTVRYSEDLLQNVIMDVKTDFKESQGLCFINDILINAIRRHEEQAKSNNIRINLIETSVSVVTSPAIINRVLDNLISNAIRYSKSEKVVIGVRRRINALEVQVLDSGVGIDKRKLKQLLKPFTQTGIHQEEKQGHGLGLFIVNDLCQKIGCHFLVKSTFSKGSCFSITIPLNEN